jgi:hypothetical protein
VSTVVSITIVRPDPDDADRTTITVERDDSVEAVVEAAIHLLAPVGDLLQTRAGMVQHLISLLLPHAPAPTMYDFRTGGGE